jgi:CheY-like chemotaxis protein
MLHPEPVSPNDDAPRLLIVDVNSGSGGYLQKQLAAWGWMAEYLPSSEAAMKRLRTPGLPRPMTILVNDDLEGFEALNLCADLRHTPGIEYLPLVLIQPRSDNLAHHELVLDPLTRVLFKPLPRRDTLLDALLSAVAGIPASAPALSSDSPAPSTAETTRERRVLVAEDTRVNQILVVNMLKRLGCQSVVAANGLESVKAFSNGSFDLVLMDQNMPEMDGLEATRIIRRDFSSIRRTPILALTASEADQDRKACLAAGMDDFLSKPVKLDLLKAALSRWVPA